MANPTDLKVNVQTEILKSCPLCKSSNISEWCKGYDRLHLISKQEFTYSRCNQCNLVFLSERPLESEIYKFYPSDYGPYHGVNYLENLSGAQLFKKNPIKKVAKKALISLTSVSNGLIRKIFPEKFSEKFRKFYTPTKPNLRLLDYGCGSDSFLNQARDAGWVTLGMDFTSQPIEKARQSGHQAILYTGPESWNEIEDGSLDFVRMNHVLEHLYNPTEVISRLKQKMKKGGILHIAIPNPGGISSLLFKNKWRGLECPRHIMLYTPAVLKKFLLDIGFEKIDMLHEIITKDFARSYGFLQHERKRLGHSEIEKKADDPEYSQILYIPARLASSLGTADRFHTFAVK